VLEGEGEEDELDKQDDADEPGIILECLFLFFHLQKKAVNKSHTYMLR
jgi:hypothetical protein